MSGGSNRRIGLIGAFERRSMPRLPAKRVWGRAPEAAAEEGELASTFVREVAGALGGRPDG